MKKNNKGFSLVELIIVIAILAILATVAAVSLIKYLDKSRKVADVNAAKAMTEEFRAEYYSNPDVYAAANSLASSSASGSINIVAYCNAGDDEWTVCGNSDVLTEAIKDCIPVRPVRYQKPVDPRYQATPEEEADDQWKYALGSWNEFTPKGWAITVVDYKPVVYVTDGGAGSNAFSQGVSPLVCMDYPGPGRID